MPMPGVNPGTVQRSSEGGIHKPTKAKKDKYIPQICDPHNLAMVDDPLDELARIINVDPFDSEYEQSTLHGMIARSHDANQKFRGTLTMEMEFLPEQKMNINSLYRAFPIIFHRINKVGQQPLSRHFAYHCAKRPSRERLECGDTRRKSSFPRSNMPSTGR